MDFPDAEREARRLMHHKEIGDAYRAAFSGPIGELVLADLLGECMLLTENDAPSHADTRAVASGKRMIGLLIMERMRWSESALAQLAMRRDDLATRTLVPHGQREE